MPPPPSAPSTSLVRHGGVAGALFAAAAVSLLAFAEGGYFRESWLPATVACSAVAGLALVLGRAARPTRAQIVVVGALAALTAWAALSARWSPDAAASVLEARRTLVYVAAVLAAAVVGGRLLAGTLAAVALVCAYAVGERLLHGPPDPPEPFAGTLLQEPLGYANSLGGLAAIGLAAVVVALLVGARSSRVLAGAAATLFVVTLALTQNRGGVLAALVGSLVAVALLRRRLLLAPVVAGLAGLALVVGLTLPATSLADDLAAHLGDRPWYWQVAWEETAESPLVGAGAGSFELAWLERQPIPVTVLDAHSLYLETLAELGLVGLVLLAVALAPPLVVALRGRHAAAAGGYVAFLVHAGVEWDWEMPAVTVAGLLCGASLLEAERRRRKTSGRSASTVGRGSLSKEA
jgi:O-antigen ligase